MLEIKSVYQRNFFPQIFVAELFPGVKEWDQPKCSITDEQIKESIVR